jgi:hypothetical protein
MDSEIAVRGKGVSNYDHERLSENKIIFESLANQFSEKVNTIINQKKYIKANSHEKTLLDPDIVQD